MEAGISHLKLFAQIWLRSLSNASVVGSLAILVVLALAWYLPRLNADVKAWLWRLAFLKILVALAWTTPYFVPLLPPTAVPTALTVHAVPLTKATPVQLRRQAPPPEASPARVTSPAEESSLKEFFPAFLLVLWSVGVLLQVVYLAKQNRYARRFRRALTPCTDPRALRLLRAVAAQLDIATLPRLATAERLNSPLLIGLRPPTVVLPTAMLADLSSPDLRLVMAHELAHLRRHDLAWQRLAVVVRVVLFFHPLVWLAQREWHLAQEMACDDLVVGRSAKTVSRYSRILLALAAGGKAGSDSSVGLSMSDSASSTFTALRRRLQSIYGRRLLPTRQGCRIALLLALCATLFSLPWQLTARADPDAFTLLNSASLGFEAVGQTGAGGAWSSSGDGVNFVRDDKHSVDGRPSGRLSTGIPGTFATLTQCVDASRLPLGQVTYSALLNTRNVIAIERAGGAGLWMRVDDEEHNVLGFANMRGRALTGNNDWQRYSTSVELAPGAQRLCFGVFLRGQGTALVNRVRLELKTLQAEDLGKGSDLGESAAPRGRNLDFEQTAADSDQPLYWQAEPQPGFSVGVDDVTALKGERSLHLRRTRKVAQSGLGRVMQCIPAGDWRGRRIAYSGYLRTQNVRLGRAGLWMLVEGADTSPLGFDNMHDREVFNTTPWRRYDVVLDVPRETAKICFGVLLSGSGEVWADGLEMRAVASGGAEALAPTSRSALPRPTNMGFEDGVTSSQRPEHWFGGHPFYGFRAVRDRVHGGRASAEIYSTGDRLSPSRDFGRFYQCIDASSRLASRVRFSGHLRRDRQGSRSWAGLWLRIQGEGGTTLAFEQASDREQAKDNGWHTLDVSAAVSPEATQICYGFHLAGAGRVWIDDLDLQTLAAH